MPIELEYCNLWVNKYINFTLDKSIKAVKLQRKELDKINRYAYVTVRVYKEKTEGYFILQLFGSHLLQNKKFALQFLFVFIFMKVAVVMDWTIQCASCVPS